MRSVLVTFLVFSFSVSSAQEVDKGSWYANLIWANATGSYHDYLSFYEKKASKVGFSFGYLANIQKKSKVSSPVQIGAEFGFMPWGRDGVSSQVGGNFTHSHNSLWINGVARFRPILSPSKINPFLDLSIGPEFVFSGITEVFSNGETRRLDGLTGTTRNYGIGAGAGIKREKESGELRYIDISLNYQLADKVRTIRRNSSYIDADFNLNYAPTIIKPSTLQLRIGLTGFL